MGSPDQAAPRKTRQLKFAPGDRVLRIQTGTTHVVARCTPRRVVLTDGVSALPSSFELVRH